MEKKKSEGEEFIEDFLNFYFIKYNREVQLDNLKWDTKTHRIADFYLPKYKVYIEFFGQWNSSPENKERYKEKKEIYFKNNIPCIYFYPENLGILPFVFDKRLQIILEKHNLNKELRKYHISKLINGESDRIGWIAIGISFFLISYYFILSNDKWFYWFSGTIILGYQIIKLARAYHKIFISKKYSLENLN